jgi:hypothetical protein
VLGIVNAAQSIGSVVSLPVVGILSNQIISYLTEKAAAESLPSYPATADDSNGIMRMRYGKSILEIHPVQCSASSMQHSLLAVSFHYPL